MLPQLDSLINWPDYCTLVDMTGKELNKLELPELEELLSKRINDLQNSLAEKDKEQINNCNNDILEIKKLIRLRNL